MSSKTELNTAVELEDIELGGALRTVARPRSEPELLQLFEDLRRPRGHGPAPHAVMLGRGSAIEWCAPTRWFHPTPETLWISTKSLIPDGSSGIIEYVPGDGTLTAQAGAPIEVLRAAVAEGGHRITPAGPRAGSTLGGLLASGASSIDRCTFGPTRHHVLGMRIQDASGMGPTRTGGRLVKNVTGYDLHRLHTGGRGTLGAILEASLRLMPVPESEVYLTSRSYGTAAEATEAALAVRALRGVQPRALFVRDRAVHLLLGGRERQVDVELAAVVESFDVATTERNEEAQLQALQAAERSTALLFATAPSKVQGVVQHLESVGLEPSFVEPDAALVECTPASLQGAGCATAVDALASIDPRNVHVSLKGFHEDWAPLQTALAQRHPIPAAYATWSERLQSSFDPSGILASPDFPMPVTARSSAHPS